MIRSPEKTDPVLGVLAPRVPLHAPSHKGLLTNPKNKTQVDLSPAAPIPPVEMRILRSDASKLELYIISCFLLAALVTPWLYNAGKLLGEVTEKHRYNLLIDSLGAYARTTDFPAYFKHGLLGSALLLLLPLICSMRLRTGPAPLAGSPWSAYLPARAVCPPEGQPLRNSRLGPFQLAGGTILAGGLLIGTGWLMLSLGWFSLRDPVPWTTAWQQAIGPAITASLLEEIIFRGVLLGIFLQTFRPPTAIILISLIFSTLHFLQPPENLTAFAQDHALATGTMPPDPGSSLSGFHLLQAILLRFQDLETVLFEFVSLTVIGLILGYARVATSSLWLPVGLHMGWIFAYTGFSYVAVSTPVTDPGLHYLIGSNLKEGLFPLFTFGITALLVVLFVRIFPRSGALSNRSPLPLEG